MHIVIFGGTTEGRELSERLAAAGAELTVCVLTDYGEETQGELPGVKTHVGALSAEESSGCSPMPPSAWTPPTPTPPM